MVDHNDYLEGERKDARPYDVQAQSGPLYTSRRESRPRHRAERTFYTASEMERVRREVREIDSIVG